MNEIQTSKGILRYRNPTVFENLSILKAARECFAANDPIGAKIVILKNLEPMIDFTDLEVKSYEKLCELGDEMTLPLSNIADSILEKVTKAFEKKN